MNGIIGKFPKGTWVEDWPNKVNLDDKPAIVANLIAMAEEAEPVRSSGTPNHLSDKRLSWRYGYIDSLGNDAFLEIGPTSHYGWVLFHTEEEVINFILMHS
jgi:hypothetical protein